MFPKTLKTSASQVFRMAFGSAFVALCFYFINYFLIFYTGLQTYMCSTSSRASMLRAGGQVGVCFGTDGARGTGSGGSFNGVDSGAVGGAKG